MRFSLVCRITLTFSGTLFLGIPVHAQQAMPPKQVGVIEMKLQEVPRIVTLPGRAVAGEEAVIRPRVSGLVTEVLYRGGMPLEAGAPMFRIDATTYEAKLIGAEAEVASAMASATETASAYDRAQRLQGSGTTQAQVETARSTKEQAEARVKSAEAALQIARAELSWTTVTSPIEGMASVANVSVGDLVTANQADALATVTRLDPIDVDMYEPSARILGVFDDIQAGRLQIHEQLKATLTLENGQTYDAFGELLSPGFTVSASTGAVDNRFRFENPERRLLPGMFVRGRIEMGVTKAFLVSQSAASRDRTGKLTAFVVENGKTVQRDLIEDGTWQHSWIVTHGLEEGELLVADGLTGLLAGMEVATLPVTYDEKGVVRPVQPADPAPVAE